jgi:hypothetical protein
MKHPWQRYSTSPAWLKIICWLSLAGFAFVLFHTWMIKADYEPEVWISEIYFNLFFGLPFFLFLSGSLIHEKTSGKIAVALFGLFFAGYFVNFLNSKHLADISYMQYVTGISLVALFILYLIHLVKKKKQLLDIPKLLWFVSVSYIYIAQRFIPGGGHAGKVLELLIYLFLVVMIWGILNYFFGKKGAE